MKINKYSNKIYAIALSVVFIVTASVAHAAVFFVSTTGNDSNNGSVSAPWRTIQKCANTISSGDVCNVANGNYAENVSITRAFGSLTTIQATNKWQAVIKGTVEITGNYVKLDGFKILKQNGQTTTLSISGTNCTVSNNYLDLETGWTPSTNTNYNLSIGGSFNTVDSNYTHDGCQGASIGGNYNIFTNNEIDHPKMYYPSCGDVDYARIFGTGHIASGNYFHGAVAEEIGNAHLDGFQSFDNGGQILANVLFEKNRIYDVYNSCFILSMTVNKSESNTGNIIRNNVCHSKGNWGIDARFLSFEAYNNTFVIDGSGYFIYLSERGNHYTKVINNIMYSARTPDNPSPIPYSCYGTMGVDCRNNLSYAISGRYSRDTYPDDYLNVDPLFVNLSTNNLRIQSASPAKDHGANLSATFKTDINGTTRPQGPAWDIGAYEYSVTNLGAPVNFRKLGP